VCRFSLKLLVEFSFGRSFPYSWSYPLSTRLHAPTVIFPVMFLLQISNSVAVPLLMTLSLWSSFSVRVGSKSTPKQFTFDLLPLVLSAARRSSLTPILCLMNSDAYGRTLYVFRHRFLRLPPLPDPPLSPTTTKNSTFFLLLQGRRFPPPPFRERHSEWRRL